MELLLHPIFLFFRMILYAKVSSVFFYWDKTTMRSTICFLRAFSRALLPAALLLVLLLIILLDSASASLPVHGVIAGGNKVETATSETIKESPPVALEQRAAASKSYSISDLQIMLEGFINVLYWRFDILITANSAKVPYDMAQAMNRLSFGTGTSGFVRMLGVLVLVFSLALGVEFLLRRLILLRFKVVIPEANDLPVAQRVWILLLEAVPKLILLVIFAGASYFFYVMLYTDYFSGICPIYLSLLTAILIARTLSIFSAALFSPRAGSIRLLSLDDPISRIGHRSVVLFSWIVAGGMLCIALFEHAGVEGDSKLTLCHSSATVALFFLEAGRFSGAIVRWWCILQKH